MGFFKRCFCIPRTADKDYAASYNRSESETSVQRVDVPTTPHARSAAVAPLATAAAAGDHMRVKVLLREGADPNQREQSHSLRSTGPQGNDRTPLHLAVAKNKRSAALALLEAKADPNARDKDGQTPLHLAAMYNAHDIVPMLLLAGADLSVTDKNGRAPLDLAPDATSSIALRRAILLAAEQGGGIKGVEAILNHPSTPPAKDTPPTAFAPDRGDDTALTYDQAISAPRRTPPALPAAAVLPPKAPSFTSSNGAPSPGAAAPPLPPLRAPAPINTTTRAPSPVLSNSTTASPAASTRGRPVRAPSPTASSTASPAASSRARSVKAPSPTASNGASPAGPRGFRAASPTVPALGTAAPPASNAAPPSRPRSPTPTFDPLPDAALAAAPKPPSPTPPAPANGAPTPPHANGALTPPPASATTPPSPLLTVSAAEAFATPASAAPPRSSSPGSAPVPSPGLPLEADEASAYAASTKTDTGASGGLVSKLWGGMKLSSKAKKSKLATDESAPSPPVSPMGQKARLLVEREIGAAAVQQQLDLAHLSQEERKQVSEELAEVMRRREMRMSLRAEDVEDAIQRVRLASRPDAPASSQQASDFTPIVPQHQQARSFLANTIPELAAPPPGLDTASTTTTTTTTTTTGVPSLSSATAHTAHSDFSTRSAATATLHSTAASPAPPAPPTTPPITAAAADYDFLPTPPPSNATILQSGNSNYSFSSAIDDPLTSATTSNATPAPAAPLATDPATPIESLLSDNLAPISENPQDDETWLTSSDPADPHSASSPPNATSNTTTPIASSDLNLPSIRASPKVLTPKTPSATPPNQIKKSVAANGSAPRTTPGTTGSAPPADRTPLTGGLSATKRKMTPASAPPSTRIPRLDVSPGVPDFSTPSGRPMRSPASTPRSAPRVSSRLEELATPRGTKRTPLNPTSRSASFSATPRSSTGSLYTPRRSLTSASRSLRGSATSIASSTNIDDRPPWKY